MTYIPATNSTVDPNNSSTATLGISGVFTGTSTNVERYQTVYINAFADVVSAINGIEIQFSTDNTNWNTELEFSLAAGETLIRSIKVAAQYFRIVYTNGSTGQSAFRFQSLISLPDLYQAHFVLKWFLLLYFVVLPGCV